MYKLRIGHQQQFAIFLWLRNDFIIPHDPDNMLHMDIHYSLFPHLDAI